MAEEELDDEVCFRAEDCEKEQGEADDAADEESMFFGRYVWGSVLWGEYGCSFASFRGHQR